MISKIFQLYEYIDWLVQERHNSIANALELHFSCTNPSICNCLSCSQVEYDLENSGKDDLRILSMDRIEQSAVPLCMDWYPPVTKESFIVTANDQVGRDHSGYGLSQWEMTL